MNQVNYYKINCDGGSRGNPGPAAAAFLVQDSLGNILFQDNCFLGQTTNNQAEYQAVINALQWLQNSQPTQPIRVEFFLDSQLVVNQMLGLYKVKDLNIMQKYQQAQKIISHLSVYTITFKYIPRNENSAADILVNQALDRQLTK